MNLPRQNKRMFRNPGMTWNLVDLSEIEEPDGSIGKK
jgi:hypothetical protein